MGDTENNDIKTPGLYLLAAHDIFQTLKNVFFFYNLCILKIQNIFIKERIQ